MNIIAAAFGPNARNDLSARLVRHDLLCLRIDRRSVHHRAIAAAMGVELPRRCSHDMGYSMLADASKARGMGIGR